MVAADPPLPKQAHACVPFYNCIYFQREILISLIEEWLVAAGRVPWTWARVVYHGTNLGTCTRDRTAHGGETGEHMNAPGRRWKHSLLIGN